MTKENTHLASGYDPLGRLCTDNPKISGKQDLSSLYGAKILLVEDNLINQEVASSILSQKQITTVVAGNGLEALAKLETEHFDCILMDIQMPVMDGYEAARAIRRKSKFRNLPILAMTANALVSDEQSAIAAGMNGHIPKPIDRDILFSELLKWIGKGLSPEDKEKTASIREKDYPVDIVDMTASLKRIGGDRALHEKILRTFLQNHRNDYFRMASFIDAGDIESAQDIAHSLKGVALVVGSGRLYKIVTDLDTMLSTTPVPSHLSSLHDLEETLAEVVLVIEKFLQHLDLGT